MSARPAVVISILTRLDQAQAGDAGKPVAGVDLGIAALATVSDGMVVENPRALRHDLARLRRRQRCVARQQKGSANRAKTTKQLAKAHRRVASVRQDALHQATSRLAKTKSTVMLEDLNVRGMLQNHQLAQAIADVGMAEFRRQLTYKGAWYGCTVVANRFYPTTSAARRAARSSPRWPWASARTRVTVAAWSWAVI